MSKNKLFSPVISRELELKSIERWKGQLLDSGFYTESQAQETAELVARFAKFFTKVVLVFGSVFRK